MEKLNSSYGALFEQRFFIIYFCKRNLTKAAELHFKLIIALFNFKYIHNSSERIIIKSNCGGADKGKNSPFKVDAVTIYAILEFAVLYVRRMITFLFETKRKELQTVQSRELQVYIYNTDEAVCRDCSLVLENRYTDVKILMLGRAHNFILEFFSQSETIEVNIKVNHKTNKGQIVAPQTVDLSGTSLVLERAIRYFFFCLVSLAQDDAVSLKSEIVGKNYKNKIINEYFILLRTLVTRLFNKLLPFKWHLEVSYDNLGEETPTLENSKLWPTIKNKTWADPFIIEENGIQLFFEEIHQFGSTGHISHAIFEELSSVSSKVIIKEPYHLSFPFTFKYRGEWYICPESASQKFLIIYKALNFPLEWRACSKINMSWHFADPMIVENKGIWYLMCNPKLGPFDDFDWRLAVFYSENPLSGKWREIPSSEVQHSFGRNAGLLKIDGALYRASQRRTPEKYGKGIRLNKIEEITPYKYRETVDFDTSLIYDNFKGHHISQSKNFLALDVSHRVKWLK